jgi:hypothetical protein
VVTSYFRCRDVGASTWGIICDHPTARLQRSKVSVHILATKSSLWYRKCLLLLNIDTSLGVERLILCLKLSLVAFVQCLLSCHFSHLLVCCYFLLQPFVLPVMLITKIREITVCWIRKTLLFDLYALLLYLSKALYLD